MRVEAEPAQLVRNLSTQVQESDAERRLIVELGLRLVDIARQPLEARKAAGVGLPVRCELEQTGLGQARERRDHDLPAGAQCRDQHGEQLCEGVVGQMLGYERRVDHAAAAQRHAP